MLNGLLAILIKFAPVINAYVFPYFGIMLIAYFLHLINYILWGKQHV